MDEHENPETDPTEDDDHDPWALLPTEVVCRAADCNLAYHRHLPGCPNCKERNQ